MVRVKVRLYGVLARVMGCDHVVLRFSNNPSVRDVIFELVKLKPQLKQLLYRGNDVNSALNILVNGRHVMFMNGLETRVGDDDIIDIIPIVIGG